MEWQELLLELVEFVKSSSGVLWTIARNQVAVECIQHFLSFVMAGFIFVWSSKRLKKLCRKISGIPAIDVETHNILIVIMLAVAVGVTFLIAPTSLYQGIARLVNPDYYAIKVLIDLIKVGTG